MTQRDYLLQKFYLHGNKLTTGDMIRDVHTAAEYRRLLCELRSAGHNIVKVKMKDNLFEYHLIPVEANGQQGLPL